MHAVQGSGHGQRAVIGCKSNSRGSYNNKQARRHQRV